MKDRYFNISESVHRLVKTFKEHRNLFIAFDFDNTVFDTHELGDTFPKMESLLQFLKKEGFMLILFTGNEGIRLKEILVYCKEHGYEPDYVNENPIEDTRKPFFNILLDDKAGLNEAYQILVTTLNILDYDFHG
jgi:hypothetical protein